MLEIRAIQSRTPVFSYLLEAPMILKSTLPVGLTIALFSISTVVLAEQYGGAQSEKKPTAQADQQKATGKHASSSFRQLV